MRDIRHAIKPFALINTPLWLIAALAIVVSLYDETVLGPAIFLAIFSISLLHFRNLTPLIAFPTFIGINAQFMHTDFFLGHFSIPWKVPLLLCVIVYMLNLIFRKKRMGGFAVSPLFFLGWLAYLLFVSFKTHSFSFPLYFFVSLLFGLSIASQLFVNENREKGRFLLLLFFFSVLFLMLAGYAELILDRTFLLSQWAQEERYRYGIMRIGSTVADSNYLCSMLIPSLFIFNTTPFKKILPPQITAFVNILIVAQIIFTFSRTGLVIFFTGTLLLFSLRLKYAKTFIAASLPIMLFFVYKIIDILLTVDLSSNTTRRFVNDLSLKVFIDNPIFGIGIGNFTKITEKLTNSVVGALDTMNTYASIVVSGGIISLLFYIGYIWLIYKKSKNLPSHDRILFLIAFFSYNIFIFTLDSFFIYFTWVFPSILLALIQHSSTRNYDYNYSK